MDGSTILTIAGMLGIAAMLYREVARYIRLVRIDDMQTADKDELTRLAKDYVQDAPYIIIVLAAILIGFVSDILGFI